MQAKNGDATIKKKRQGKKRISYRIWAGLLGALLIVACLLLGYFYFTRYKTLAEFKDGKVTREDFIKDLRLEAGKYDPLVWKNEEQAVKIKKDILEQIIKERILLVAANKSGITVDENEFKTDLDSFKSGYTETTFNKMLELKGISYNDWVAKKRNKYIAQKLIEKEVIDKMNLDPAEIKKYYNEHINEFSHLEQVRARHILVSSWDEAEAIDKELNEGGNFAAIAKNKSISPERWNGGDLGYFSRGTFPEIFDRMCFNMPVGETSQVVKSEYGYHIFKVVDKRGPVRETLEEATPSIVNELKRQRSKEAFDIWFKPIYDAADVHINDKLLKQIEVTNYEDSSSNP